MQNGPKRATEPRRTGNETEGMIVDTPTAAEAALSEAQRAIDNAIRTIFELATRLELLGEALERAKAERPWQPGRATR